MFLLSIDGLINSDILFRQHPFSACLHCIVLQTTDVVPSLMPSCHADLGAGRITRRLYIFSKILNSCYISASSVVHCLSE